MNVKPIFDWGIAILCDNISIGITDLSLSIPAFDSKLEQEEINKAMEGVKVKQIKEWGMTNIGDTQTKKRRETLKMGGRKKCLAP